MKTKMALLVALCFTVLQAFAQGGGRFNFRFLDDATGIKVMPDYVEIRQRGDGKPIYKLTPGQIQSNGTATLQLPDAVYDIKVAALRYDTMKTWFGLKGDTINVTFSLVPLRKPFELSYPYIASLHKMDMMIITGYVAGDSSGSPVDSVAIYTADTAAITYTDFSGYFQLILPLSINGKAVQDMLYFSKTGYKTEVLQKFDMWSMGDAIFKVRLKKGEGVNITDVLQKRQPQKDIPEPPRKK